MTSQPDDQIRRLEQALVETYRAQPGHALSDTFMQRVMSEIRQGASRSSRWAWAVGIDQLVWRAATVTAALVLIVAVCTVGVVRATGGASEGLFAEEFEPGPLLGDE
jgi:hypothetical protein